VSWKLSCTVLRGGTTSNGGSLLDRKTATGKQPYALALAGRGIMALAGSSEDMICWPVSARVGNVRNNDPSLIEPIVAAG
jgi:hypothetical protein